jgi:uncharacterized protein (DUF488 family)
MLSKIWTIGHSTRPLKEFIDLLRENKIKVLADVRSYPGSKRFPHFNKENLAASLAEENITYVHIPLLGGRRKAQPDSVNTAWKNEAFRGYADYMETDDFKKGIHELLKEARKKNTAYMCSEAVWWRCHRSLISDYLKANGWEVIHIMGDQKTTIHPYTTVAAIKDGRLSYNGVDLFSSL